MIKNIHPQELLYTQEFVREPVDNLCKKIDKLDDVALMLKINASNELEEQILNDIIELINTEKQKMINVQKRVENITSGFTR